MTRVFLVDDEMLVRHGLRKLLEFAPDIEIVGEAGNGAEALERIPPAAPDVVLLDVRMPQLDGIGVLAALRARAALPPSIVLTTFDDAELLLQSVRQGARGFLQKDVALEELLAAIRAVAAGATWFQPVLTNSVRRGVAARDRGAAGEADEILAPLTDRERDVLRLMVGGLSNREIATTLETAEGTVKNQVSSILSKLGVRDRTRAVLKAIQAGVV
jgi:DNA-binding NarL/FixJ family response regulator